MNNDLKRYGFSALIPFGLTVLFAVLLVLLVPGMLNLYLSSFLLILTCFAVGVTTLIMAAQELLIHLLRQLYRLPYEEAAASFNRILFGLPSNPPEPILGVREGRVDPDGPEALRLVGGPGYLSVSFENAAITSRGGRLFRVLGPGFHTLKPFERVWEVIDLRPQRRTIPVNALTKDGIPISCHADIRFRIDGGDKAPTEEEPYPFTESAVLTAAVLQRVIRRTGKDRVVPWQNRIAGGVMEGALRDRLERFRLDDLLLAEGEAEPPLAWLEKDLEQEVQRSALALGVQVERVQVGSVLPAEDEISSQWLETWQAEWQRISSTFLLEGEASQARMLEMAHLQSQVELITGLQQTMQNLSAGGVQIPPTLIILRFLDVMRSLTVKDPFLRTAMPQQAEKLLKVLDSLQTSLTKPELPGGK